MPILTEGIGDGDLQDGCTPSMRPQNWSHTQHKSHPTQTHQGNPPGPGGGFRGG